MKVLLAWLAVLAIGAYFSVAAFFQARMEEDPFNQVAYADLVAPWRWSRIPILRAEATLARGKDLQDRGQLNEALFLLRVGLERIPGDVEARVRLASIYLLSSRRDLADKEFFRSLSAGVANDVLVRDALAFLGDSDRPDQLVDFCQEARAKPGLSAASLQALAAAESAALVELGRYAEALAVIDGLPDAPPAFAAQHRARIALASADTAAAREAVSAWIAASPRDPEALAMAIGVSRQAGRLDEMDINLAALRALAPGNPSFASMGVVQNLLAQRPAEAGSALDQLVLRFGADAHVLEALARDLGKIRAYEMLNRLDSVFAEHGFDSQILWFSRLNAQMDSADWPAAERSLAALESKNETLSENVRAFRQTAAAALDYCLTGAPAAKSTVLDQLVKRPVRLKFYLRIHDWFASAERWEGARDVLVLAEGAFPGSRRLEERRRALAPRLSALTETQAEAERRSEAGKKEAQSSEHQTAAAFLATLATHGKNAAWEELIRAISTARRRSPPWLGSVQNQIDQAELRALLALDDLPRIKLAAATRLHAGSQATADEICAFAREAHSQGHASAARILVSEVLRHTPGHAGASALLLKLADKQATAEP